jgi:uncharacterized protein with FMN-binding domain
VKPGGRIASAVVGTVAGITVLIAVKSGPTPVVGAAGAGSTGTGGATQSGGSSSTGSTSGSTGASGSSSSGSSSALRAGTYTGDAADTRYGPVQVKITVAGGKVTQAEVVDVPMSNPRDAEINQQAVPILVQETAGVTSAQIDFVSGATFTSDGYQRSLQSALDKAKG